MASPVAAPVSARISRRVEFHANSLIITIFGDAILPRGGNIWLGSLIALAEPFGLSERLVRTGVYRLARDGWLSSAARGRRSYYSITEQGLHKFDEAHGRIYASATPEWDGLWRLVQIPPQVDQAERQALRRALKWLGFGQLGPTLLARPGGDARAVSQALGELALSSSAIVFNAALEDSVDETMMAGLVAEAWPLEELNAEYARFLETFAELDEADGSLEQLSDVDCFALRILLIHDYRRILLKDPQLPRSLLPGDWKGALTRDLCKRLYARIAASADRHLVGQMKTIDGEPPPLADFYWRRFGGLG